MFKASKIIFLITIITLSSCSIFRSKSSIEPTITTTPNNEVVQIHTTEKPAEKKKELPVNEEKPQEEVVEVETRAQIGPFTPEESAVVVLPEYKNTILFTDIELNLTDLKEGSHYPVDGELSSPYGWRRGRMHTGVDIRAPRGTDICATFDGVVRFAKYNGAYGNCVVIRHYNGLETMYAHATKILVEVNQEVSAGDVIALVGRTGRATGDHLHFEVRAMGQCINPNTIIDTDNRCIVDKNLYITMRSGRIFASNSDEQSSREDEIKAITSIKYHIVKSGDTLSRIAANNRTTVTNLCKMNNISSTSILSIGQRVRVQ